MSTHAKYIGIVGGSIIVLCGLVLSVNALVDPLWFFNGNRITEQNARYNERYSKSNQFLKAPDKYNCVILGSSTALLLEFDKIKNHHCFNYAFSRGHISEYADFLRFVNSHTDTIELVIVSFDAYNLLEAPFAGGSKPAPPFIRETAAPPGPFPAYLGIDPLIASIKTLLRVKSNGGHYDTSFRAVLADASTPYDPHKEAFSRHFRQRFGHAIGRFDPATLHHIETLKSAAGSARVVGYGPPIIAHYIAYLRVEGTLNAYLESLYRAAGMFDAFFDFTIPSEITRDADHTVDGMHFYRTVNDKIAETIAGTATDFGIRPWQFTFADYRRRFIDATDAFLAESAFLKKKDQVALRER